MLSGNMLVLHPNVSTELRRALHVIDETMHSTFARQSWNSDAEQSKKSCILASLTIRDFLKAIGFETAEAISVCLQVQARGEGQRQRPLLLGDPMFTGLQRPGQWNGHMVARVPEAELLIDTTLYRTRGDRWPSLPGMIAAPTTSAQPRKHGLEGIGYVEWNFYGAAIRADWYHHPENGSWVGAPDTDPERRAPVVAAMLRAFEKTKAAA